MFWKTRDKTDLETITESRRPAPERDSREGLTSLERVMLVDRLDTIQMSLNVPNTIWRNIRGNSACTCSAWMKRMRKVIWKKTHTS